MVNIAFENSYVQLMSHVPNRAGINRRQSHVRSLELTSRRCVTIQVICQHQHWNCSYNHAQQAELLQNLYSVGSKTSSTRPKDIANGNACSISLNLKKKVKVFSTVLWWKMRHGVTTTPQKQSAREDWCNVSINPLHHQGSPCPIKVQVKWC